MIELEGKFYSHHVSILVYPSAILIYVNPQRVEKCDLQSKKFKNPWLVQLATGAKRRVNAKVSKCPLEVGKQHIKVEFNILPLGSYDILLGMDWLEVHWSLVDYKEKVIYYKDEDVQVTKNCKELKNHLCCILIVVKPTPKI